jgi:hypothetical protein
MSIVREHQRGKAASPAFKAHILKLADARKWKHLSDEAKQKLVRLIEHGEMPKQMAQALLIPNAGIKEVSGRSLARSSFTLSARLWMIPITYAALTVKG